jgi:hypothetical protein
MTLASVTTHAGLIVVVAVNPNHPAIMQAGYGTTHASDPGIARASRPTPCADRHRDPAPHEGSLLEQAALSEVSAMKRIIRTMRRSRCLLPNCAKPPATRRQPCLGTACRAPDARRSARAYHRVARAALQLERVELFESALARTLALQPRRHGALHLLARRSSITVTSAKPHRCSRRCSPWTATSAVALEGAVVSRLRAGAPERAAPCCNNTRPAVHRTEYIPPGDRMSYAGLTNNSSPQAPHLGGNIRRAIRSPLRRRCGTT